MPFVLDASVTVSRLLEFENHPLAIKAFERLKYDQALVPTLWWYETHNILLINERRKKITRAYADEMIEFLKEYPIHKAESIDETHIMHLAREYRLTVYDASYLALAEQKVIPLATLDNELIEAAKSAGIELL